MNVFQAVDGIEGDTERHGDAPIVIDIEVLAAPAFLVEPMPGDAPAGLRLNAAGRAEPDLVRWLSDPSASRDAASLRAALRSCAAGARLGETSSWPCRPSRATPRRGASTSPA